MRNETVGRVREDHTGATIGERLAPPALSRDLEELIAAHERIDWAAVEGVSVAEAAAWTARLAEAREQAGCDR